MRPGGNQFHGGGCDGRPVGNHGRRADVLVHVWLGSQQRCLAAWCAASLAFRRHGAPCLKGLRCGLSKVKSLT